jgi:hypothetical protein
MSTQSNYMRDFKADVNRSTYRWIIYLTNGYHLTGYSRKEGKTEILDKWKLFQRKVIMLANKDYFNADRVDRIEFYKRTSLGEYQEKLITLRPKSYDQGENKIFNSHKATVFFLETVYNLIKCGNLAQLDYSMVPYSRVKEENVFDLKPGRFKDIHALQTFCNDQIIEGFPMERVEHFQRMYKERYFNI